MFWASASRSQAEHVLCHINPRMNNPCKLNFRSFELFVWLASYTLHPRSWTVVPESHDGLEDDPASFPDLASFQGVNSLLNFQSPKTRIDLDAMMASVRRAKLMLEADVSWVWRWVGILMYISCSERGQCKKTLVLDDILTSMLQISVSILPPALNLQIFLHIVWYITISGRGCSYFQSWRVSLCQHRDQAAQRREAKWCFF